MAAANRRAGSTLCRITMYDTGHIGGIRFIATEFIEGMTLRTLLGRGRVDVRQSLDIATQVAQALVAAHAAGVVHRDLKPENVMVRADGYVKVRDFGLAKLTGSAVDPPEADAVTRVLETAAGVVMGRMRYMAPEQARGEEIDARTDLFALGVVFYEMLAGEPPFTGATAADIISALLRQEPLPIAGSSNEAKAIVGRESGGQPTCSVGVGHRPRSPPLKPQTWIRIATPALAAAARCQVHLEALGVRLAPQALERLAGRPGLECPWRQQGRLGLPVRADPMRRS